MLGGNSVQDSATLGGQDAGVELEGVSLLVLLDEFKLFQLLEAPPDDLSGGVVVLLSSRVSSSAATVEVGIFLFKQKNRSETCFMIKYLNFN